MMDHQRTFKLKRLTPHVVIRTALFKISYSPHSVYFPHQLLYILWEGRQDGYPAKVWNQDAR